MMEKGRLIVDDIFITTTDTVVGLGGPVNDKIKKLIFKLKKRSKSKNLIIVIGSMEQARDFPEWNEQAEILANQYWPGAFTLVLNKNLALRMPNCNGLRNYLIEKGPCYLTSANISGKKPIEIEDAKTVFPEVKNIFNFGEGTGKSSTIIDVNTLEVLR